MATTRPRPVDHLDDHAQSGELADVKKYVLLSGAFLLLQVAATDYGPSSARATGWFAIGVVLLWLVYRRRSRVARGIVVVLALVGAVIYLVAAFPNPHATVLVVAYLGQALPLLSGPVRRHVQERT